jgi:hypothetical protein
MTAAEFEDLMVQGLLRQRNDRLMEVFAQAEPGYEEIFIPWGAAHLPDLERRLMTLGYEREAEHSRRIIDFAKVFHSS